MAKQQKQPVADLSRLKVGSVPLTGKPTYGYDHYSFHREDAIVLGVTGYRVCDDWIECIGFENFFPRESHGTHFSGWGGMSGGYTRCNTYHDIPTLQKNANLYLIQEGTGKTWEEYGSGRRPYVPRDVLSRAHATRTWSMTICEASVCRATIAVSSRCSALDTDTRKHKEYL